MEIAQQGSVAQVETLCFLEPAAELGDRPMGLGCRTGVIDHRQDDRRHGLLRELARASGTGPVYQTVDALCIEALHPQPDGAFAAPAVADHMLERNPD